jgi:Bacterial Ig-like domain
MRSAVLRTLAVIGIGAALLVGVLYVASTVDARAPEVVDIRLTQPVDDEPDLALITTSIEVAFTEAVEMARAERALGIEPSVDGNVSWSGSTMIFTPSDPLALETVYTVTLDDGVVDLAGNEMVTIPGPFVFETAGRPTLVETDPIDGAADVPLDDPIALRFSTLMDTASVEEELRLLPTFAHELRWSGELLEIVPVEPLTPDRQYEITVGADAADIAGVALGSAARLGFWTVAPGLSVETIVPADGIDGIATSTPIAIVFDRRIDPDTVEDNLLVIEPEVAGTLEVIGLPGDPLDPDGGGRVLAFTPSGALPANTTFEVTLLPGVAASSGGGLTDEITWSFTTGAPTLTLSNQVVFLSDRAGIANVWAMNADGTGQRQVSAELASVVDYAVAPDGSSLVVGDGHRLVFVRPDGSERRVLSEEGTVDFDAAYAPDSGRLAFARGDEDTGAPLGLWEWAVGGGDPVAIELPLELGASPPPTQEEGPSPPLRAPRYAPDGRALAFVDATGSVGILGLSEERLTLVAFDASSPPRWMPDSAAVLVTGRHSDGPSTPPRFRAPVAPLAAVEDEVVVRLGRSASGVTDTPFGEGSRVVAIAADGTIAFIDAEGALWLTDRPTAVTDPPLIDDERVLDAAFAPGEPALVVVIAPVDEGPAGRLELAATDGGERTPLVNEGWQPRWLP